MGGDVACVALLETTSGRCNERPLADTNQVQVAPLRSVGHRGRAHVNLQQGSVQSSHEKLVCPSTVLVHALIVAPVDSPPRVKFCASGDSEGDQLHSYPFLLHVEVPKPWGKLSTNSSRIPPEKQASRNTVCDGVTGLRPRHVKRLGLHGATA